MDTRRCELRLIYLDLLFVTLRHLALPCHRYELTGVTEEPGPLEALFLSCLYTCLIPQSANVGTSGLCLLKTLQGHSFLFLDKVPALPRAGCRGLPAAHHARRYLSADLVTSAARPQHAPQPGPLMYDLRVQRMHRLERITRFASWNSPSGGTSRK